MQKYKTEIDQEKSEINSLAVLLVQEDIKSYLEIGCRYGGSLWYVANRLPKGSRVVGIDVPIDNAQPQLEACVADLKANGYDAHLLIGNSRDKGIIAQAANLGPYDAIFIDADHTLAGVTADWNNYRQMACMIAFHDIAWDGPTKRKPIQVSHLWRIIKNNYRHVEFVAEGSEKGIGVLWRN